MDQERYTGFARWLRALLAARGISHSDFARQLDMPRSTVSKWLVDRIPSEESCDKIALALDVPLGEVLAVAGHRVPSESFSRGDVKDRLIDLIPSAKLEVYIPIFEQLAGE